jgi:cell division protein FtsQ
LAKLKAMDADAYPQEVLAEEEPRYLRRQKPLEIKRRKFGRKAWITYLQVTMWLGFGIAGAWAAYVFVHFLLSSPEMALIHPEQVELSGNRNVSRGAVLGVFAADRGRSVLRIPLEERRRQLESISWVERATVRRAFPNKVEVDIVERTPIAYLREGSELSLVDVHGVILDRPLEGDFHFPVVTGISTSTSQDEREKRMQLFVDFSQQAETAHPRAMEQVSEVDLSQADDLCATIVNLGGSTPADASWDEADAPLLVHFGGSDFEGKYRTLVESIGQWRAKVGRIGSVDLRFSREAIVDAASTPVARSEDAQGHSQAGQAQGNAGKRPR